MATEYVSLYAVFEEFGGRMNSMPKYVVSTTPEEAAWNGSVLVRARAPVS